MIPYTPQSGHSAHAAFPQTGRSRPENGTLSQIFQNLFKENSSKSSPYYVGNRLWDKLDSTTQTSKNIFEFANILRAMDINVL